jgi:hypothetical protein
VIVITKELLCHILILTFLAGCTPEIPTPSLKDLPPIDNTSFPTLTPAPFFNQCPEQKKDLVPEFEAFFNKETYSKIERGIEQPILDFLNKGGSPDKVTDAFTKEFEENQFRFFQRDLIELRAFQQDLTNDNIPELIIQDFFLLHIFGCRNGHYVSLLNIDPGGPISYSNLVLIQDMNLNGVPDLVISEWRGEILFMNLQIPETYRVMEWDDSEFKDLIIQSNFESRYGAGEADGGRVWINGVWSYSESDEKSFEVADIDNNGTLELILRGGLPTHSDIKSYGPWRAETNIYMWNDEGFVIYSVIPTTPIFRFQAIQDADYALFDGDYDKALALYQDAIFNEKLDWWSNDKRFHERQVEEAEYYDFPSPTPLPVNSSEYSYLSAYAYYRIMTIYAKVGNLSEARVIHETLKEKYHQGKEGHLISELATVFWTEFLISQNLSDACAKAIDYTSQNPFEIFNYVGSIKTDETYDWVTHGLQKEHFYTINDICPFK